MIYKVQALRMVSIPCAAILPSLDIPTRGNVGSVALFQELLQDDQMWKVMQVYSKRAITSRSRLAEFRIGSVLRSNDIPGIRREDACMVRFLNL